MAPHQYIFIVRLADEYFDVVASNRQFAGSILQGCLARYSEVRHRFVTCRLYRFSTNPIDSIQVDASPARNQATFIIEGISSFLLVSPGILDCARHYLTNVFSDYFAQTQTSL